MDETPSSNAKAIIPHSKSGLVKKPKPARGKKVKNNGTTAQCNAQRVDAVMPTLSSRV